MIFLLGIMKSLPPNMKSRKHFMTGECGFHDGGKVDFPDGTSLTLRELLRERQPHNLSLFTTSLKMQLVIFRVRRLIKQHSNIVPHNLTLFTTSRRVLVMISRVRRNSRNQATKQPQHPNKARLCVTSARGLTAPQIAEATEIKCASTAQSHSVYHFA